MASSEKMIVQQSFELMRVQTLCLKLLFVASSPCFATSSDASLLAGIRLFSTVLVIEMA